MQLEIKQDPSLVAYCGLYCGACRSYLKGRCPGCHENRKATWCKVRTCCGEHSYTTCASCQEFPDPQDCRKFNNLMARVIGVLFNSNRRACVLKIRELGVERFATFMTEQKRQTLPRRGS